MTVEIVCADARKALAAMPEGSVHCAISSPPYWGLRDYGLEPVVWGPDCEHEWGEESYQRRSNDGGDPDRKQETNAGAVGRDEPIRHAFCRRCNAWCGSLGLEPTPDLYVEHLVAVMRDVRRVLRDDGTLWLNLGDSYAASRSGPFGENSTLNGSRHAPTESRRAKEAAGRPNSRWRFEPWGLKPKDLCGMPWRVAFALQADGWWLRSDIVWSKPNPMPESVRDRPTRSHEYLFLLSKSARYYYDADAIREPHSPDGRKQTTAPLGDSSHENYHGGDGHERWPNAGRNKRSVWEIATQPYAKAHFATFPEKLVEPCILAGTSERGCCPECGAPWERVVETTRPPTRQTVSAGPYGEHGNLGSKRWDEPIRTTTTGWHPTCKHDAEPAPCTVLDPFAGSGTVGLVAERLGRHSILIDANEDYCRMARERTAQMGLMEQSPPH